ncbi:hypothetical protein HF863_08680 [Lactobacillus agilis]|uniref:Baseplate upper protein immunoglobulin like domain-containing protein n=1 Tax=Ligilactobacillus agilis TaxID=1601 RepID=A0A6F9Y3J9_9LACO|nr:hypothetical protein [Ligilactobacillus agilis]NME42835.1 hypothetical protein [Ligilactobacillus agilis]GET12062.1 hypothetical protein SN811_05620 [Ligilactobacillus agilis]
MAYRDNTPITAEDVESLSKIISVGNVDQVALQVAKWLREKMYGNDVREALAQWTIFTAKIAEYLVNDEAAFKLDVLRTKNDLVARQTQVESRQTDLENAFKSVISNATKDSEVILARSSSRYGAYLTLDDRIEYLEQLIGTYVPSGFTVTIKHNQNRNPDVKVRYYEYALGTEPDGIGTGPKGSFGGTNNVDVPTTVEYKDANTVLVHLPTNYRLTGAPIFEQDKWRLIDGYKTLSFDLGTVDTTAAIKGNSGNSTSQDNNVITAPQNLHATAINDTTEKLIWE